MWMVNVGILDPPPPSWGNFSHMIPFFFRKTSKRPRFGKRPDFYGWTRDNWQKQENYHILINIARMWGKEILTDLQTLWYWVRTPERQEVRVNSTLVWGIDTNSYNWEPEFMTIFVTSQFRVTLDGIRNPCNVCSIKPRWKTFPWTMCPAQILKRL